MTDKSYPGEAGNNTVIGNSGIFASVNTSKITFGKYKGRIACDIVVDDPQYVMWAAENVSFFDSIFSPRDLVATEYIRNVMAATDDTELDDRLF